MNEQQFPAVLVLLVPQIIGEYMRQENISEDNATALFYNSELYASLENERTKLWHLSPMALTQMFIQELASGKIIYPEEA